MFSPNFPFTTNEKSMKKTHEKQKLNFSRSAVFHMRTRVCLKYFVHDCRLKKSLGVKFKNDICAKLCLKLWLENNWYFCNITESGWF